MFGNLFNNEMFLNKAMGMLKGHMRESDLQYVVIEYDRVTDEISTNMYKSEDRPIVTSFEKLQTLADTIDRQAMQIGVLEIERDMYKASAEPILSTQTNENASKPTSGNPAKPNDV